MADQELKIRLTLDKSLAAQASKDYHAGERQRIRETVDADKAAEKDRLETKRRIDREIAESNKAAKEKIKRENKLAADQQKAIDNDLRWAERQSESARIAAAKKVAQARIAAERDAAREAKRIKDQQLRDIELKRRAEIRSEEGAEAALNRLALQYIGIGAAVKVIDSIGDAWKRVAEQQRQAHAEYIEILKNSRVGAAVSGVGPKQYAAETAATAVASGLSVNEADNFIRQFEGTVPIGKQLGNIDDATASRIKLEGAKYGARLGGDQGTRGELLGILPQFSKITSKEEAMGKAEAVRIALTEGRGDDSPLTRSLLNVVGKIGGEGGMVGSIEENAALVGTTSLASGPLAADQRALQISRAVRGTTKESMQKTQDAFGLKVGNTLSLEQRLEKIIPKLLQVQASGGDVVSWLRTNVDMPQEEAEALREFMPNFGVFKGRAAKARETAKNGGAAVVAENAAFASTDAGRALQTSSENEAAGFLVGENQRDFQGLVGKYGAKRKATPSFGRSVRENMEGALSRILPGIGSPEENDTIQALHDEIERRGLKMPGSASGMRAGFTPPSIQGPAMMATLREAGVDPFSVIQQELDRTIAKPLEQMVEETKKQTEELKKMNKPTPLNNAAPRAIPARP